MTGYTVHTGSTVKFSSSWDRIFSEGTIRKSVGASTKGSGTTSKSSKKVTTKKVAAKHRAQPSTKVAVKKQVTKSVKKGK